MSVLPGNRLGKGVTECPVGPGELIAVQTVRQQISTSHRSPSFGAPGRVVAVLLPASSCLPYFVGNLNIVCCTLGLQFGLDTILLNISRVMMSLLSIKLIRMTRNHAV